MSDDTSEGPDGGAVMRGAAQAANALVSAYQAQVAKCGELAALAAYCIGGAVATRHMVEKHPNLAAFLMPYLMQILEGRDLGEVSEPEAKA